ncbi:SusC/RagA family TonB-linked outer membrane protein [Olleya namhaensis]|uniref:TonB-linked outer membrane protein, SusC/RagA family n=1 Tax=Olleya namhaensis TaxID=1144750 RepID=A0A1I3SEL6_9FLAO|nr:TonB-dependent receptor [Olleya namhaensis]SFJ57165.1 TonB-linked outer membrane protein, SusC/RagA family [Olleya namhaensis]
MNLKAKSALFAMLFMCIAAFAQDSVTIKGAVVDAEYSMPLPNVNVIIVGTSTGASTDFDGNYQIQAKKGDVIQFSYIGYTAKTVIVGAQTTVNVALGVDANTLEEVVIVGYGTQKKSHLTGSISKVTNEDLDQIAVSRVDDALVGQVSGVNIAATQGEAGSAPTIRIRGTGSVSGSSDPLIVVDGLVVDNDYLGSLNMNDVASFEVLKDAASAAIYGSRGGNGVIMITTKEGKSGKTKFTYNTLTGFKEARQSEDYYFSVAETAAAELAATGTLSDRTKYKQLIGIDNDWQNIIFDGGVITTHSFSARGGDDKTKFSTSLGYIHDEGVLLTDEVKNYSYKLRLDTKLTDKLSMGINLNPSFNDKRRFDGSTHDILRQTSWLPVYHDENTIRFVDRGTYPDVQVGDYATQRHFDNYDLYGDGSTLVDISNTSNTNPAAKVLERQRNEYKLKLRASLYGKYDFNDNLSFKSTIGGDYQNTVRERNQGPLASRNGESAVQYDEEVLNVSRLVSDNFLSYNKGFGNHDVSAVLGASSELQKGEYKATRLTGYNSELEGTLGGTTTVGAGNQFEYKQALFSYFLRVNYAYDDKYLASISLRRDGSSVFGEDNKYGTFPAASLGWNISKEDFLSESEVVNNLKFRVSYGVTGNNALRIASNSVLDNNALINYYPSLSLASNFSYAGDSAISAINIANPDLKWERSVEINPGIDFGLFNNRITGSVDVYKRTSDQLLLSNPISNTTGFSEALVNIGKVENRGIELELRTKNVNTQDFKWTSTMLASRNKNELIDFADSNGQILNVDSKRAAEWINQVGQPISSFYGWVVESDIPLEYIANPYHPIGGEAQDVYVKDLNGDGVIDDDDKTKLGDPYPDIVWSFTNDFQFGDVDLSFMFQGSHGAEVRNMGDQYLFNHFNSSQDFISSTPNQQFIKQKIFTDDIIQDASYVALRTVSIGYNFTDKLLDKTLFSKARVYATGQNLLYVTASDYTGFNPESVDNTSATTYGYQRGGSPIQRTISVGLNLEF